MTTATACPTTGTSITKTRTWTTTGSMIGRIETTTAKAKELRPVAERLITLARRGDVHSRRLAGRKIQDRDVLGKLFDDIAPRYAERPGGYTRILKLGSRQGDGAEMSLIELVR